MAAPRRFIRAHFSLNDVNFLPISHGDVFEILRKLPNGHLNVIDTYVGREGCIPRTTAAFYVNVTPKQLSYVQPVILVGSLSSHIHDLLLERKSDKFNSPVPHTSRERRINEKNGIHYWFVKKDTMEQMVRHNVFVDCAELNGQLYGTTEASVRVIAQREQKHCLLDSSTSIPRLLSKSIFPIVILVGAQNWQRLYDVVAFDGMTEEQARHLYNQDASLLNTMAAYINAVVVESSLETSFNKVLHEINRLKTNVWIPQLGDPSQRLI